VDPQQVMIVYAKFLSFPPFDLKKKNLTFPKFNPMHLYVIATRIYIYFYLNYFLGCSYRHLQLLHVVSVHDMMKILNLN